MCTLANFTMTLRTRSSSGFQMMSSSVSIRAAASRDLSGVIIWTDAASISVALLCASHISHVFHFFAIGHSDIDVRIASGLS
jgi:hypothetical protein